MGKISKIFNFDNIGSKIKNLAKWSCWITILLLWIAAPIMFIVLVSNNQTEAFCWIPLVSAIVGPVFVWIGGWAMYAFGEFVEDTHAIRNKYYPAEEEKAKQIAAEKAERKAAEKARREAEAQAAKREAQEEQLSVSDVEGAVSAYLNRRVSISEITCTLIYVIPKSTGKPKEMHLDMIVSDQEITSLDLFFDQNRKAYYFKGRQLALDSAWRAEKEIFAFDVSAFKTFNTEVDEED